MILGGFRSNNRHARNGWGITNGIRVDPHDLMGVYELVKKDKVAYGSGRGYVCMTRGSSEMDTVWYICC
jgi:hypothetical protein